MLKRLLVGAALLSLLGAPVLAAEQELDENEDGQIVFVMPSGNVGCTYTPEGGTEIYEPAGGGPELICERVEPSYVTVILGPKGKPKRINNPGEQGCCGAEQVLDYGNESYFDGFVCYSERTGLVCETDDGAHGFSMARAKISTW